MFKFQLTVDTGVIVALRKMIQAAPTKMRRRFGEVSKTIQAGVIGELKGLEPGPVKYPIRWTSEKQRRYVMRKLRKQGNIPYRRTHDLINAWRTRQYTTQAGGFVTVTNSASVYPFIMGDPDRANWQQQFHINTGWPTPEKIEEVKVRWSGRAAIMTIKAWQEVAAER